MLVEHGVYKAHRTFSILRPLLIKQRDNTGPDRSSQAGPIIDSQLSIQVILKLCTICANVRCTPSGAIVLPTVGADVVGRILEVDAVEGVVGVARIVRREVCVNGCVLVAGARKIVGETAGEVLTYARIGFLLWTYPEVLKVVGRFGMPVWLN